MMTITLLTLMSISFSQPSFAADGVLYIGYCDSKPLAWNDNGEMRGLFVEILEQIASDEEWTLHYSLVCPDSGIVQLQDERLDLLLPCYKNPGVSDHVKFNNETIISTWAQIFALKDVKITSVLDMKNRSVAVVHDAVYNRELRDISTGFDLNTTIVEQNSTMDVLQAVENGWVDLGVVDHIASQHVERQFAGVEPTSVVFAPMEIKFAANAKNLELLQVLDYHLRDMKSDHASLYYVALNRVFFDVSDPKSYRTMRIILISAITLVVLASCVILILRFQIYQSTKEITTKNEELNAEKIKLEQTEEALTISSEILEDTFSSLMDGALIASGSNMRFVKCNKAAVKCFECSEKVLLRLTPLDFINDDEVSRKQLRQVWDDVKKTGLYFGRLDLIRRNGEKFIAEVSVTAMRHSEGKVNMSVIIVRDITERIKTEESLKQSEVRLQQAQKMEALGTLAGGIAHDFNNILTPIIGYADMVQISAEPGSIVENQIKQIIQAAERAKALIAQIMTFSRKRKKERKPLHISPVVKEGMKLLRAGIPANIELKYNIQTSDDIVLIDPTEIHQVLMNLCANATFAMRDKGGTLSVTLDRFEGNMEGYWVAMPRQNIEYICLSIADTGQGIPEEILHCIMDPFFTTKAPGEGTGIGLSVVHGIVTACKGTLSIDTTPGVGTTFNILFPLADIKSEQPMLENANTMIGGNEHIVVVDDETMILKMISDFLRSRGYTVSEYSNGIDALEYFESNSGEIDIVITDQSMPKLTGMDMAARMLAIKPSLPIILCTGFSETASKEAVKARGIREFFLKPYSLAKLAESIRGLLDESADSKIVQENSEHVPMLT